MVVVLPQVEKQTGQRDVCSACFQVPGTLQISPKIPKKLPKGSGSVSQQAQKCCPGLRAASWGAAKKENEASGPRPLGFPGWREVCPLQRDLGSCSARCHPAVPCSALRCPEGFPSSSSSPAGRVCAAACAPWDLQPLRGDAVQVGIAITCLHPHFLRRSLQPERWSLVSSAFICSPGSFGKLAIIKKALQTKAAKLVEGLHRALLSPGVFVRLRGS